MNEPFSIKAIAKSEMRVLETLQFNLKEEDNVYIFLEYYMAVFGKLLH